ncbi:Undecaprenyl-phosphate galactose phosphotransferase WbaP/exopolysaccharide biosynthesis polyprenyl glycosylphosphotransferase [Salinibacterium amurskyense]|uniref:Undecaprenyl-phosphate galactose phosphotransferase WbaP/exopolysaccharide biosynthesis polyprenyl glycosylphosphotransferase n=1 Tax=Salinibacterium amurskyense TaxID=205941 RepID=A0A2M9D623_9MICO|nr:sugar transferase [Salinibacterium amurskyense]PJJ81155.1 Undecaprenyl-phosphate galactose phosphotransferase WbaP/exopolysaccharide biosynthesis polyprenyl glycosylphosphotransferase [Salinibacterium amurskyense]RLQ83178.1 sugar transferase [Salinibacterium amurskyense]GHD81471.1 polyprenyl glycosylphosphotransferase [Salinibacterium amurskyense]
MSQLRKLPALPPTELERGHLRLVEDAEFQPQHVTAPHPDSGIVWTKSYQKRLLVSDAVVILGTILIALLMRADPARLPEFFAGINPLMWLGLLAIVVVWVLLLEVFRSRDRRVIGVGPTEYKRVVTACMTAFGLLSIILLVLEIGFPGKRAVLAMAAGVLALLATRWVWRRWLNRQRRFGHALSRTVVVGTQDEVDYVVDKVQGCLRANFDVVGVVIEPDRHAEAKHRFGSQAHGTEQDAEQPGPQFGPEQVVQTASSLGADTVIIAGEHGCGNDFIRHLAWQLEGTAAELILASRLTNVAGPRIHFRPVEGLPLIHVEIPQFEGGKHVIKRGLDIAVSGLALFLLSPLFLLLTILIRLDSPGGAFYSQVRVGRNLETFRMFKFRSMVVDADQKLADLTKENEGSGVLFKLKNDPRVTRLGRFIRKYSLDEFPQLWNVLKGDMSLVGPRPPLPSEVLAYKGKVNRRMYIKPGLTGMWQINGRSDLNWEDSMRLDLYYVENWSVVGDLVIMWRTFKVLINPVGAY